MSKRMKSESVQSHSLLYKASVLLSPRIHYADRVGENYFAVSSPEHRWSCPQLLLESSYLRSTWVAEIWFLIGLRNSNPLFWSLGCDMSALYARCTTPYALNPAIHEHVTPKPHPLNPRLRTLNPKPQFPPRKLHSH